MTRLYIVTDTVDSSKHLVEAESQASAIGVVVGSRYEASSASALDAAKILQAGGIVLQAPKRAPKAVALPVPPTTPPVVESPAEAAPVPSNLSIGGYPPVAAVDNSTLSSANANTVMAAVAAGNTAQ